MGCSRDTAWAITQRDKGARPGAVSFKTLRASFCGVVSSEVDEHPAQNNLSTLVYGNGGGRGPSTCAYAIYS